jgi:hypothetical protein
MKQAFGLNVPQALEDVCDPRHLALVVYDMQVGIKSQVKEGDAIVAKIRAILEAARASCSPIPVTGTEPGCGTGMRAPSQRSIRSARGTSRSAPRRGAGAAAHPAEPAAASAADRGTRHLRQQATRSDQAVGSTVDAPCFIRLKLNSAGRGRPNSENLPVLDDTLTYGSSDPQCRQVVEPDSFGASTGDAISLALLAQCMP